MCDDPLYIIYLTSAQMRPPATCSVCASMLDASLNGSRSHLTKMKGIDEISWRVFHNLWKFKDIFIFKYLL